jgi:hypothetical protein
VLLLALQVFDMVVPRVSSCLFPLAPRSRVVIRAPSGRRFRSIWPPLEGSDVPEEAGVISFRRVGIARSVPESILAGSVSQDGL